MAFQFISTVLTLLFSLSFLPFTHAALNSPQIILLGYSLPPYTTQAPSTLASITYSIHDNGTLSAAILPNKWTPPPPASSADLQIGLISPGSAFGSKASFSRGTTLVSQDLVRSQRAVVQLLVDGRSGEVWGVGLAKVAGTGVGDGVPEVVVVPDAPAPMVVPNRPVVLTEEGKVKEAPPEKTLLQKYWWVLLAVAFFALSAGNGGDGK